MSLCTLSEIVIFEVRGLLWFYMCRVLHVRLCVFVFLSVLLVFLGEPCLGVTSGCVSAWPILTPIHIKLNH